MSINLIFQKNENKCHCGSDKYREKAISDRPEARNGYVVARSSHPKLDLIGDNFGRLLQVMATTIRLPLPLILFFKK